MYSTRVPLYRELEAVRGSKLLVYVTGDRRGAEAQIHSEVLDLIAEHLGGASPPTLSLLLYSRGGSTMAGWSLANFLRQHCRRFEVLVPAKAHSAATLICLGADRIVMTTQATLGPIDPSVNGPLNPRVPGSSGSTVSVSVEDVAGFLDLARKELGVKEQAQLVTLIGKLAEHIHPLSLGKVYRSRIQIQQLAEKLLSRHWTGSAQKKKRLIAVLCGEAGSHDYTINAREAKEELGLPVEAATPELARLLRRIYADIRQELELLTPFEPAVVLGANPQASYACKQALIESVGGGSHAFVKEGLLKANAPADAPPINQVIFHGWRHEVS